MTFLRTIGSVLLLLVLALPASALEQSYPLTLQNAAVATGNGTAIEVANYTSVALTVTISATATVTFEGSEDGSTYASRSCVSIASTTGTGVTSATATGTYQCSVAGLSHFRARISSFGSGTVTVHARATTAVARVGGGSGLPPDGTVNDCILNTAPGTGTWQACPGAAGGDSVSVDGVAVVDPNFDSAGDIDFVNTANVVTGNVKANSVALGTDTTGNYAAGDAEGGAATSGDSATSFFSSGTIEDARLPTSMADKAITGSLNIPNGAAPTTDAFGEIAGDNNAWGAGRGAVQFYDGTANTFLLGTLATDTPLNGECPKWNTGGTITWETCAAGGSVATDAIFNAAGDLVQGTGADTSARLPIGTANQVLKVNAGATAVEWGTLAGTGDVTAASSFGTDNVIIRSDGTGKGVQLTGISVADTTNIISGSDAITFGSDPGDAGRLRLSNNESICWELATPGTDKCLTLNASDEFELNAPLNLTGTAGALLQTGVVSPSAPATAEQWYFYADSVDNLPKYIYNGETEQTFYTTANPQTTITGNAGTATALAANPADCGANQFATTIAASGALTCAAITDADVPNTITASNYLPLAGGTLTGSLVTDNLGIEFEDSDTNPTCGAGEFKIYADLSEVKFKKCMNGSATDLDTTGGTPDFGTITGGTNTTAAMVVGTGSSLAASGSGTIAATTAAALAANGGNCSAGSYPLGVGADGAVESCTALASESVTYTNKVYNAASTGNDLTIKQERVWDTAGCVNTTAGSVFNLPVSNPAVATCDTGANIQSAYMAFNADTDQAFEGRLKLQTGFTGSIDWIFDYKMASATTGAVGWCVQMVRVLPGTTAEDPAYPAQASGNCVSDTVPGTAGLQKEARITAATCTSCAAGDTVYFRVSRDANGGAVTDSATGNGELLMTGPAYAVVY